MEEQSNQIGMFDPTTRSFSEFNVPTPDSLLEEIATDYQGNVWFTELNANNLGELNVLSNKIQEFKIPIGPYNLPCGPIGVTASRNGPIWITCDFSNQIDEFFPTNSSFLSFDLPVFHSAPLQIVFDQQGNFWFTAADSDMLGYAVVPQLHNGTSDGIQETPPVNQTYLTTISVPEQPPTTNFVNTRQAQVVTSLLTPSGIAMSQDGKSLWITEHTASSFDRYDIQSKTLTKYWTPAHCKT